MNGLLPSAMSMMLLALESHQAAQLRLYRLSFGGVAAIDEAALMVREKIEAFGGAMGSAMTGGSVDSVIGDYRTIVRANIERLSEPS